MRALDRISGYAHVAQRYGLEEAIFLDSLMFWYKENRANGRNFRDGRWWTYNSVSAFEELFPWWSGKQIRRIAASCKEKGALLAGNYNTDQRDRTLWYTPGDELLALYGLSETGNCICPDGQMETPEGANELAQMGKCNIEHVKTHVETYTPLPPVPEAEGKAGPAASRDEAGEALDGYAGEDGELRERLEEFREVRRQKKKPLRTRRAAVILTGRLDRLSGGERKMKLELLDTAILHGWDSVYPLKEDGGPPGRPDKPGPLRGKGVTYL